VSIVPLEIKFLDLSNGNKFQNVIFLFFLLDENPGQKCDYLEMRKNEGACSAYPSHICCKRHINGQHRSRQVILGEWMFGWRSGLPSGKLWSIPFHLRH
jgi:hypothetical protein